MTDTTPTSDFTDEERARFEAYQAGLALPPQLAKDAAPAAPSAPEPAEDPEDDLADVDPLYAETMNGKRRFLVVEANLHTQLSDGSEVLLRLDPPAKVFRQVMKEQGDAEELDQLFLMLKLLGQEGVADKLEDLGILELTGIVTRFFSEFQKKLRVEMGESSRSSRS